MILQSPAQAAISDIVVSVDGSASGTNGFFSLNTVSPKLITQKSGDFESRILWEFDLSSIPSGATITGAEFIGVTDLTAGLDAIANLTILTYAGNGALALADAEAAATTVATPDLAGSLIDTPFSFPFSDVSDLQTALNGPGFIGVRGETINFDIWHVFSLENAGGNAPATLRITWVPEPATWSLLALCGAGFLRKKTRGHQNNQNGDAVNYSGARIGRRTTDDRPRTPTEVNS